MEHFKTLVIVHLAAFIFMTSNLAVCQDTPSSKISPGSYLRVSVASLGTQTVEGTIAGFENGLLLLDTGSDKAPLRIDMADVTHVELRTKESTRGKDTGWGAAVGALGLLALVAATDGCRGDEDEAFISHEVCYGSTIVIGGIVGALAGLVVSHGDRWEPVSLVGIGRQSTTGPGHQGQFAEHHRGLGLSLSVMF